MNGPKFIYDDGREAELEWRPIKTVAQAKAPQPRPPYHLRGRESGGPFLINVPSVESVTVPSFGASMKGGGDGSLVVNLPMNGDGSELKPVSIGEVVWAGSGIDRRRVAFLGGQGRSASLQFPIEVDRRWESCELRFEPRDDGWVDFDAYHQAVDILRRHEFPQHWGVEHAWRRPDRKYISRGDGGGFGHAWAWIGSKLCWAELPEHGLLDVGAFRESWESPHTPTRSSWNECKRGLFHKAYPLGSPFHWALWVANFIHAHNLVLRFLTESPNVAGLLNEMGRLGFDLGQFMAEHRLRQLHSDAIEAHHRSENKEVERINKVKEASKSKADKEWRDYSLRWLQARRAEKPAYGQEPLAEDLMRHFDEKRSAGEPVGTLPGKKTIVRQIARWEQSGALERSTSNRQGRATKPPN